MSNSTNGTAVNDAANTAEVAAAPNVGHGAAQRCMRSHVNIAALAGNSQQDTATENTVYAVAGAAPATWANTAASAVRITGRERCTVASTTAS